MHQSDDSYEPYAANINVMIEKAYREKKQSVTWEEGEDRFEVDFVRMVEEEVGGAVRARNVVKVKRESGGQFQHYVDVAYIVDVLNCPCPRRGGDISVSTRALHGPKIPSPARQNFGPARPVKVH